MRRVSMRTIAALSFTMLGLFLGAMPADWFEVQWGITPDHFSGLLEFGLATIALVIGIACLVSIARRWSARRTENSGIQMGTKSCT